MVNPFLAQKAGDDARHDSAILFAIKNYIMEHVQSCLPAIVEQYDRDTNRAIVRPIIQRTDTNDEMYNRGPLYDIPVMSLGAGGFHLSFPIKKGNYGWIIACDRDIDIFKQQLKECAPNTSRCHSFADSWFIPDVWAAYSIQSEDNDSAVLQSVDGFARVAISSSTVKITAGGTQIIVSNGSVVVNTSAATINGTTTINGDTTINGALIVSAGISAGGAIKGAAGVDLTNHKHIDSKGGNTQGPIA